jgi:hypothetical protein
VADGGAGTSAVQTASPAPTVAPKQSIEEASPTRLTDTALTTVPPKKNVAWKRLQREGDEVQNKHQDMRTTQPTVLGAARERPEADRGGRFFQSMHH